MRSVSFLLFLLTFAFISWGQTIITGILVGPDGKPIAKSVVHLFKLGQWTPIDSVEAGEDGTYRISVDKTGPFLLQYSGLHYPQEKVLLVSEKGANVAIKVNLAANNHSQAGVIFSDPSSSTARAATAYSDWMRLREALPRALEAHLDENKPGEFRYDFSPELERLGKRYDREKDQVVRHVVLLCQADLAFFNRPLQPDILIDFLRQAINEITPASSLWSLSPGSVDLVGAISEGYGPAPQRTKAKSERKMYGQFVEMFLRDNADHETKAVLMYGKMMSAKARNDDEAFAKYYNMLFTEFGDTRVFQLAQKHHSANKQIAPGKPVPKFSLTSLTDPSNVLTNESFSGKIYLIDFWATWCAPCVEDLPYLHKAYEAFSPQNFEIISISLDADAKIVDNFRRGKWKMPWQHAFLDKKTGSKVRDEFEVLGPPKLILVDGRTGRILATDGDLRGDKLEKTLSAFVGTDR